MVVLLNEDMDHLRRLLSHCWRIQVPDDLVNSCYPSCLPQHLSYHLDGSNDSHTQSVCIHGVREENFSGDLTTLRSIRGVAVGNRIAETERDEPPVQEYAKKSGHSFLALRLTSSTIRSATYRALLNPRAVCPLSLQEANAAREQQISRMANEEHVRH